MIKFKIKTKTPKNYIEILKIIGIEEYTLPSPQQYVYLFVLLFSINIFTLVFIYIDIFENNYGALALVITIGIQGFFFFKFANLYLKNERKQITKRFYKIFNIKKKNPNIIEFIKNNIYFIEELNLSNEKLIQLIKNYKVYEKEIDKIKKDSSDYDYEISKLTKEYENKISKLTKEYENYKETEQKLFIEKIIENKQKVIESKQKVY